MLQPNLTDPAPSLAPVASNERIQALDVVRGIALIGIFLMNVEYFNRALDLSKGLPTSLHGIDWVAGWLIYTFVQGKFWTMFSLLFGMGFAVMLTRAERSGRNFLRPYLRRVAALAVFGAMHHMLIWGGDILFGYAAGATGLLLLLWGDWRWMLGAVIALVAAAVGLGVAGLPGANVVQPIAAGLSLISLAALYLRWDKTMSWRGGMTPVFAVILQIVGALALVAAALLWLMPSAPLDARWPVTCLGGMVLLLGVLAAHRDPPESRTRRLGAAMYLFPMTMILLYGLTQYFAPQYPPEPTIVAVAQAKAAPATASAAATKQAGKANKDPEFPETAAGRTAQAAYYDAKHDARVERERELQASGTYAGNLEQRVEEFGKHAADNAIDAEVYLGMFLIGLWFVRSGVMENTAGHLPLFRHLAKVALPAGLLLGLLGVSITTTNPPGVDTGLFSIMRGLVQIGNLPACLGYVSLFVLALHSRGGFNRVRVFAPLGRMALTNYLTQSLVSTWFFYGHGLGHYGMGRAMQVVYVFTFITVQLALSTWWLSRFRYGPMEWLWRAITYWTIPPMRRELAASVSTPMAA